MQVSASPTPICANIMEIKEEITKKLHKIGRRRGRKKEGKKNT